MTDIQQSRCMNDLLSAAYHVRHRRIKYLNNNCFIAKKF